jgi:hypothetical protein
MSVYKVRLFKDESLSAEYRVTCVQGSDPDCVLVRADGTEEDVTITESYADSIFEGLLDEFLTLGVLAEGNFISSAVSDGGGVVSSRV